MCASPWSDRASRRAQPLAGMSLRVAALALREAQRTLDNQGFATAGSRASANTTSASLGPHRHAHARRATSSVTIRAAGSDVPVYEPASLREPRRERNEIRGPDPVSMHENGCRYIDAPVPGNPGVSVQRPRTCDARDRGPLGPQPRQGPPVLRKFASGARPEMDRQETTRTERCRTHGSRGLRRCHGHSVSPVQTGWRERETR